MSRHDNVLGRTLFSLVYVTISKSVPPRCLRQFCSSLNMNSSTLTANWWADQVGDSMNEVDHTQGRGQVGGAHDIGRHHWDECYVRSIKVPIEHSQWDQEGEGVKGGDEHTAEAFHAYRQHVAEHAILLQTPTGEEIYQYRVPIRAYFKQKHDLHPLLTSCL